MTTYISPNLRKAQSDIVRGLGLNKVGLTIYESVCENGDGGFGVIVGAHEVFTSQPMTNQHSFPIS